MQSGSARRSTQGVASRQSFVGQTLEAITLGGFGGESTGALTDNYLKIRIAGEHVANRWVQVEVSRDRNGTLVGWCVENHAIAECL